MNNSFTAYCIMLFTLFVCIACVSCLTPVFSSFGTVWTFLCQYISFQILLNVGSDIYNYIKVALDKSNKKDKQ